MVEGANRIAEGAGVGRHRGEDRRLVGWRVLGRVPGAQHIGAQRFVAPSHRHLGADPGCRDGHVAHRITEALGGDPADPADEHRDRGADGRHADQGVFQRPAGDHGTPGVYHMVRYRRDDPTLERQDAIGGVSISE